MPASLGEVFEDPTCDSALAVLRRAPTARAAARRQRQTLADSMRPGGRRRLGDAKARRLQELARETVAPPELDAQVALEVELLIEQYDLLGRQIEIAEKRVGGLLDSEVARRLQTIAGVGPDTAATLMAEIGDIWRFDDVDQLAAFAGVHPKEMSSGRKGEREGTSWHMAKTGNAYLRSALYRVAVVGTQHNPVIRDTTPRSALIDLVVPGLALDGQLLEARPTRLLVPQAGAGDGEVQDLDHLCTERARKLAAPARRVLAGNAAFTVTLLNRCGATNGLCEALG